jgi:3-deoxy-D-manno-octulosonic-acid transferase
MRNEETLVLSAFRELLARDPEAALILAPRHPERFSEAAQVISQAGLSWQRRTRLPAARKESRAQVILLDSLGELALLYALADVVFIGGSLVPTGGHNILEPALFSKPVLFGPHMSNFREVSQHFLEQRAAIQVATAAELGSKLVELSQDTSERQRIGERGYAILSANRGALDKVLNRVQSELGTATLKARSVRESAGNDRVQTRGG